MHCLVCKSHDVKIAQEMLFKCDFTYLFLCNSNASSISNCSSSHTIWQNNACIISLFFLYIRAFVHAENAKAHLRHAENAVNSPR